MVEKDKKPKSSTPTKPNNLYMIILIVIVVVLVGVVWYWQSNNNETDSSSSAQNNVQTEPEVCSEIYCFEYTHDSCPTSCDKRCVPSGCVEDDDGLITCEDDCNGIKSCYCDYSKDDPNAPVDQDYMINFDVTGSMTTNEGGDVILTYTRANGTEGTSKLFFDTEGITSNCTILGDDLLCQEVLDNNLIVAEDNIAVQGNKVSNDEVIVINLLK